MLLSLIAAALLFDAKTTPLPSQTAALHQPPAVQGEVPARTDTLSNVSVRLRCVARATGAVTDCRVVSETLPGYGFGETAVALMESATVEPPMDGGHAVDAVFERTIDFMP